MSRPFTSSSGGSSYTPLYDSQVLDDAIKHWVQVLKAAPTSSKWEQSKIDTVATETAIAELSRRADLGPASRPTGPAHQAGCDLTTLATFVPAHVRKALLTHFTPLSERTDAAPYDLTSFWIEVEAGLRSIHPSLSAINDPLSFGPSHVTNLGPIILGVEKWQQLEYAPTSWGDFKACTEHAFGLT